MRNLTRSEFDALSYRLDQLETQQDSFEDDVPALGSLSGTMNSAIVALSGTLNSAIQVIPNSSGTINARFLNLTGSLIAVVHKLHDTLSSGASGSDNDVMTSLKTGISASFGSWTGNVSIGGSITGSVDLQIRNVVLSSLTGTKAYLGVSDASTTFGSDAKQVALNVANTSSVDNNFTLVEFGQFPGTPHALFGVRHTNHSSNYGEFWFGTRAADGFATRAIVSNNGIYTYGALTSSAGAIVNGTRDAVALTVSQTGTTSYAMELQRTIPGGTATARMRLAGGAGDYFQIGGGSVTQIQMGPNAFSAPEMVVAAGRTDFITPLAVTGSISATGDVTASNMILSIAGGYPSLAVGTPNTNLGSYPASLTVNGYFNFGNYPNTSQLGTNWFGEPSTAYLTLPNTGSFIIVYSSTERLRVNSDGVTLSGTTVLSGSVIALSSSDVYGRFVVSGSMQLSASFSHGSVSSKIGVFGATMVGKQTVTGSCGGNTALKGLLNAMAAYGWITDNTTF